MFRMHRVGALLFILDQVPQRLHSRASRASGNIGTAPVFPLNRAQGLPNGFFIYCRQLPGYESGKTGPVPIFPPVPTKKTPLRALTKIRVCASKSASGILASAGEAEGPQGRPSRRPAGLEVSLCRQNPAQHRRVSGACCADRRSAQLPNPALQQERRSEGS